MICRICYYLILEVCHVGKPVLFGFTDIRLCDWRRNRGISNIMYGVDDTSLRNSRIPKHGGMAIALYTAINVAILYYRCNAQTKCAYPSRFIPANIQRTLFSKIQFEKISSTVSVLGEESLLKLVQILWIFFIP